MSRRIFASAQKINQKSYPVIREINVRKGMNRNEITDAQVT